MQSPTSSRTADAGAEVTGEADASPSPEAAALVHAERLAIQRQRFDLANERRVEFMREHEAMRDLLMAMLQSEHSRRLGAWAIAALTALSRSTG